MTPFTLMSLWANAAALLTESHTVISLRLMAISGLIPQSPGENERMVAEKLPALTKSHAAAGQALMAGQRFDQVMEAALAPLSSKVRANRKRLMK